jgi:hypothetical protein
LENGEIKNHEILKENIFYKGNKNTDVQGMEGGEIVTIPVNGFKPEA